MKYFVTENEVYKELFPELLAKHEGKFAVIKDRRFLGVFDSYDGAYAAGLQAFGVVSFLLRHITATPRIIRNYTLRTSDERVQP